MTNNHLYSREIYHTNSKQKTASPVPERVLPGDEAPAENSNEKSKLTTTSSNKDKHKKNNKKKKRSSKSSKQTEETIEESSPKKSSGKKEKAKHPFEHYLIVDQNWNSEEVSLITIPKQLRSEHPFEQLIVDKRMMNGEEVSLITIPKPLRKLAKKHPFEQLIVDKGMINGEEVSLITIPKPLRKLAKNHPFEQLIVDKEMMNGEDVSLITIRKPLRKLEKQQQKNNKTAATLIKVCRFPKKENMDDNKIEEIQKQRESSEQITGHKMLVSEDMTLLQICESPKVLELLARCRRHEHEMSRLIPAPGVYRYANK